LFEKRGEDPEKRGLRTLPKGINKISMKIEIPHITIADLFQNQHRWVMNDPARKQLQHLKK